MAGFGGLWANAMPIGSPAHARGRTIGKKGYQKGSRMGSESRQLAPGRGLWGRPGAALGPIPIDPEASRGRPQGAASPAAGASEGGRGGG